MLVTKVAIQIKETVVLIVQYLAKIMYVCVLKSQLKRLACYYFATSL